jgi:hypothetical protein
MKKTYLMMFFVLFMYISAFAEGTGTLILNLPDTQCQIYINGAAVDITKGKVITKKLSAGVYDIKVKLVDEDTYAEYTGVVIGENETTLINVPWKEKGAGSGFGFGLDASKLLEDKKDYFEFGPQYDISWFYSTPIARRSYFDMDISLYRPAKVIQSNSGSGTLLAIFPFKFSIKNKINNDLMFGCGINTSIWVFNEKVDLARFTHQVGYQVFLEILPISTEIGYMIKNVTINSLESDDQASGLYVKYRLYI